MPFPILGTLASLAAGYAYDKWMEKKQREQVARSLKGFGNLRGLHPSISTYAKALVLYLREDHNLPAVITESGRTRKRQAQLYAQGRSTQGEIVTWTRDSKHVTGRAFDLAFAGYTPDDTPESWYETAGEAWEDLGGTWGGRWERRDMMHFEA